MLPSMAIYLSRMAGVWAGEVPRGAVGTADEEPWEHGPPRDTLFSFLGAVAVGSCGTSTYGKDE